MSDRRWLVVGHLGMLGTDLMAALEGRDVAGVDRPDIDITDPASVDATLEGFDVVVNCAAYTAVDAAEENEALALAVNGVGPGNLARACARSGARLVHISTDYVFDGTATSPYPENAPFAPRSAYGRTKAAGEVAVLEELPHDSLILRTAWLYGAHGPNFIRTMIDLERTRDSLSVVDDQRGQPTWSADLAERIVACVDADVPAGIYHATSSGQTTWFGLARRVFELLGADPERVTPTTTDQFPRPAPRPAYSVLGHDGWGRTPLPPLRAWDAALDAAWPALRPSS
jgi:dTDP-4-dehydrorhamnose reductase